MAQPRIVVSDTRRAEPRASDSAQAWKWLGWFSALLAFVGLSDFVLAWVPFRFGVPEWEFATVVQTFSGLPLVAVGLVGVLASGVARGARGTITVMAFVFLLLSLLLVAALGLFLLDVPLALRAAQGPALLGVQKAIVKTILLGVAFGGAFAGGGIVALRRRAT